MNTDMVNEVINNIKNGTMRVPVWLFTFLLLCVLSLLGFTFSFSASFAHVATQTQINTEDIIRNDKKTTDALIKLDNDKVDKTTFEIISIQLNRIEQKLDQHIDKK
jgi:uncharacterized membrane protein YvbJ